MSRAKKPDPKDQQIAELTNDLQRVRADFENYRKRAESEREMSRANGKIQAISALLPVIDNIERAITHRPKELDGNAWADGVESLIKNLEKSLESLSLRKINATKGSIFNPEVHEAVQFDEDAKGDHEVIAEELQSGYLLGGEVIRPSIVKVTKK